MSVDTLESLASRLDDVTKVYGQRLERMAAVAVGTEEVGQLRKRVELVDQDNADLRRLVHEVEDYHDRRLSKIEGDDAAELAEDNVQAIRCYHLLTAAVYRLFEVAGVGARPYPPYEAIDRDVIPRIKAMKERAK